MTARPNPFTFAPAASAPQETPIFVRPNVTERFWGYEVSRSEHVIDLAVLARGLAALTMVGLFVAAALVWLVPDMAFVGDAFVAKSVASIVLASLGLLFVRFAGRGTRIRVQVDTSAGELREVVDGMFGSDVVLSRYGFDAVKSVEIVTSGVNPSYGQVHILMEQGGPILAADGTVVALRHLRAKLAADCGHDEPMPTHAPVWGGARTA